MPFALFEAFVTGLLRAPERKLLGDVGAFFTLL
jgi:hypothetical protein